MNQHGNINTGLKERIMRRVYAIWFVRRALPFGGGALFGFFIAYRATAESFFVAKIVENFFAVSSVNLWGTPHFVFTALLNTDPRAVLMVAFSCIIAALLSFKLFSDIRTVLRGNVSLRLQRN